jgi:tRNA (mo5U34)-methyltransferase
LSTAPDLTTADELREEIVRLGPWHIDIEVTPEVSTSAFLDAPPGTYPDSLGKVNFHDPREGFLRRLGRLFPRGLEGRSVLDCACNCGAYLFYAKEAGAGRCVGFDLREHWVDQARFLARHRQAPTDDMRFEVADLYDLPNLGLGRFDVTLFLGIFYHLPDVVTGLKAAADVTGEALVVNTATFAGRPDGLLVAERESPTKLMSGGYGLCWFPTGPGVLAAILGWLGFPEVRCSVWRHAPRQRAALDRLEVIGARTPGFFDDWDAAAPEGAGGVRATIDTATRPGATVLVLADELGDALEGAGRTCVPLAAPVVEELERRRGEGAAYLALDRHARAALDQDEALAAHLSSHARVIADNAACRIYSLEHAGQP